MKKNITLSHASTLSVSTALDTNDLDLFVVRDANNDLTVSGVPSGPVAAGTPVTLHVDYNKAMTPGQSYNGELLLGPASAPSALSVPIKITR